MHATLHGQFDVEIDRLLSGCAVWWRSVVPRRQHAPEESRCGTIILVARGLPMISRGGAGRLTARAAESELHGSTSTSSRAAPPAWYDVTWNPTAGCSPVGPGCDRCEALRTVAQLARIGGKSGARYAGLSVAGRTGARWTGELRIRDELLSWPLRQRKGRRILVNSLSDLFHEKLATETVDTVHAVMAVADWHRFLTLTRRAERMRAYYSDPQTPYRVAAEIERLSPTSRPETSGSPRPRRTGLKTGPGNEAVPGIETVPGAGAGIPGNGEAGPGAMAPPQTHSAGLAPGSAALEWPLTNLGLGVSVEDQQHTDRIAHLLQTPAVLRWACFEPLLGPVRPDRIALGADGYLDALAGARFAVDGRDRRRALAGASLRPLDWVVAGGETGAGARAIDPDWVRDLRDRCEAAAVPFSFSQWGEWAPAPGEDMQKPVRRGRRAAGRLIDGRVWEEMPALLSEAADRSR
jgi:protein gp37